MAFHRFNIGNVPEHRNEWWRENIRRGVVTAGFEGVRGDKGDRALHAVKAGDWLFAYVSGKGYVGAGEVLAESTYVLHPHFLDGSFSVHRHERGVAWRYVIRDVDLAIELHEAQLGHPLSTRSRVKDTQAAEHLLQLLRERGEHLHAGDSYGQLDHDLQELAERASIPETQREALVDARLGQGAFRCRMLARWQGRCAVTGVGIDAVLIASHAKPWRTSTDEERLDPCNGLPLVATLDRLFDQGLVAFHPETGEMKVSPRLAGDDQSALGLPAALRRQPSAQEAAYLEYHLKHVFHSGF
ncbi:HNH endonuclease [Cupriavidus malaysiensis]|uniref:HNH nuclease domain-containing protein n=1 Tax=Cupriavidus malaysiensis TaxID=367825 RepID=A0ABN4TZP3_9BURK|nr:HNH endonuclease [Cupriavidus malaysiensis]AOZ11153.1 hypothetical protein BKK80_34935 [Cupriavidus malaysiensis]